MNVEFTSSSSFCLNNLPFTAIKEQIKRSPSLLLPLGGLESFGNIGDIGLNNLCVDAIAATLAKELEILVAPPLLYGCTTRYKSFSGCLSVKPKMFSSFLASLCRDCFFQGFKRVIILNSIEDNELALELLKKRFNNDKNTLEIFSLHADKKIREYIAKNKPGLEMGRSELAILSMASFLRPESVTKPSIETSPGLPEKSVFLSWRKRGKDPEKFRKIFCEGHTSENALMYDPGFGCEMFQFILDELKSRLSHLNNEI